MEIKMDFLPIKRALISVTHKTNLDVLANFLSSKQVELVSTGGTLSFLEEQKIKVTSVSDVTGFPEIMGGRVKSLHPAIHGGILADKDNPEHLKTLAEHKIATFDLVVVNLYDFAQALNRGLETRKMIEEIDIGGPCLLRAAAKNYHSILVLPSFEEYGRAIEIMQENNMTIPLSFRKQMAAKTFALTSNYDQVICKYLGGLSA